MSKKKGLGKGLGALIRSEEQEAAEAVAVSASSGNVNTGLRTVEVLSIRPNPHQPRTEFVQHALDDLSASIREHGLIQPLIVTEDKEDGYILIAGERRWRASQLAGLTHVPVVVKADTTPQEMLELALIENVQRADLNAVEEGLAYQALIEEFGMTHSEAAQRVGKGRPTITNMIRLLDLPPSVQQAVVNGMLSGGHARALLPLATAEQQNALMTQIIEQGWSVRHTENVVRKLLARVAPKPKPKAVLPPGLADVERQFRQRLGTRVNIEKGKEGGKVVIHYYSDEELNAIYDAIIGDEL